MRKWLLCQLQRCHQQRQCVQWDSKHCAALPYGELQTRHGDLAKENQSTWQRTAKTTVVLNCDPLNCVLFDMNLHWMPSFTSTCIFFICPSRNPFYSSLMGTPHKVTQLHKIPNSTKFFSTCWSTQGNPTSHWEKVLYAFSNASWLYHMLLAAPLCSGGGTHVSSGAEEPQKNCDWWDL